MKKVYKLVDLDCANCAAKMTIVADDVAAVMPDVLKCIQRVEPDCQVVM